MTPVIARVGRWMARWFGEERETSTSRAEDAAAGGAHDGPPRSPSARWRKAARILTDALELDPAERHAFLDRACGGDDELRVEVEELVERDEEPGPLDRLGEALGHAEEGLLAWSVREEHGPAEGESVGHYRVQERLGRGGMGVVYRARDLRLDRTVALKFLPRSLPADPRAERRFLTEAQAAAALEHPNICTIHEIAETPDGRPYIVMACYEGRTLREELERGPMEVPRALDVARQVARGLACAHERDVIHRDVKPGNLMLTPERSVKVLDFGLARIGEGSVSKPGTRLGTVAYMSPEQVEGREVDGRTDLWSLGVVLYEMLAGRRPFGGGDDRAVLRAILDDAPPSLRGLGTEVPETVDRLVELLLTKEPSERPASARRVLEELERVEGRVPAGPRPALLPGGERRQVAVLVARLPEYGSLLEQMEADALGSVLARFRRTARRVVERHGGVVNQEADRSVVALFGVPAAHEDDACRAARAAFELRRALLEAEGNGGPPLRMAAGVDSGALATRPSGEPGPPRFRIAGSVLERAEALAGVAEAGEILAGPGAHRGLRPFFETEPARAVFVGKTGLEVTAHRLVGESGLGTRIEAAAAGELTPFAGREVELRALESALLRTAAGEGQLVSVVGEAGAGKSRLVHEFCEGIALSGVRVVRGRCQSYGGGAYHPFIECVKHLLGVEPGREDRDIAARVREISPELEDFVPLYLHLLSIESDDFPVPRHLEGERFRMTMLEALSALLTLGTGESTTVLLLEDWHWADPASQEVLRQVTEMVSGYPVLVVVTCRPGRGVDWGQPAHHTPLHLGPLPPAASASIVRSVLGVERLPAEVGRLLHERTGGNPFFLEEMSRTLSEQGLVRVEGVRFVAGGALEDLQLPDTVEGVIRTRLDRMERSAREVLMVASVVGREFRADLLERAAPPQIELPPALGTLRALGLIHQVRVVPEATYRFKHALTQQVAYESLLDHRRQSLHATVGRAVEASAGEALDEQLDRLTHHFAEAQEWGKAVRYGRAAARKAQSLARYAEALDAFEQVLGWIERLPPERARVVRIEVLFAQERLCETLGRRAHQRRISAELLDMLDDSDEGDLLAEAHLRRGDLHTLVREFGVAEASLRRSLQIALEIGDPSAEVNARRSLGLLRWHQGRDEEALEHVRAALALDRERGRPEAVIGDLVNLANVLGGQGRFDEAREHLEEALALAEEMEPVPGGEASAGTRSSPEASSPRREGADGRRSRVPWGDLVMPVKRTYIFHSLGVLESQSGDDARALEMMERARALAEEARLPVQASYHYTSVAHIHLRQGRIDEALSRYREAVDLCRKARHADGLCQSLRILGEVLVGLGRRREAVPVLREAAQLHAQLEDWRGEAAMWRKVGEVYEAEGNTAGAVTAWAEVRRIGEGRGDDLLRSDALEGLARVTRSVDPGAAARYLREALAGVRGGEGEDRVRRARLLNALGMISWERGDASGALGHYERMLGAAREAGDDAHVGLALNSLGVTLRRLGRQEEAAARLEEAIVHNRRAGERLLEGHGWAALGDLLLEDGDAPGAAERFRTSLEIRREIGDRRGEAWMLQGLARAHARAGAPGEAARYTREARKAAREIGDADLERALEESLPSIRRGEGLDG